MKKRKKLTGLVTALAMVLGMVFGAVPAAADAMRVVTLGADLSDAQKQTMLNYFKVNRDEVRIIYVTNADERSHLGSYVPLEQIGTRTVSCAFVRPTTSGGIKVRTANLNWVTGNMIATALSTSGVSNCEVIAACPFEVSGTGALTGVLMAYEVASGTSLDTQKKEIATEEIVVTGNLADSVGQNEAVNVINKAKMEVIGNNIQTAEEIYNTVVNIVNENHVAVSTEELEAIVALLEEIAGQHYDYDDMAVTLEMVESNVAGQADEETIDELDEDDESDDVDMVEAPDEDSIFVDIDEEVLGDDVVVSSTDDGSVTSAAAEENAWEVYDTDLKAESKPQDIIYPDDTAAGSEESWDNEETVQSEPDASGQDEQEDDGWGIGSLFGDLFGSDDSSQTQDQGDDDLVEVEASDDQTEVESDDILEMDEEVDVDEDQISEADSVEDADLLDASALDSESQTLFKAAQNFCKGEFEGDTAALREALNDTTAAPSVSLDSATGAALSMKIQKTYLSILGNGGLDSSDSVTDDIYFDPQLNLMEKRLKEIFGIDGGTAELLPNVSETDRQTLYKETLAFFEELYGENSDFEDYSDSTLSPIDEEEYTDIDYLNEDLSELDEEAWD